ncbi:DDE-type integrase/transposase/recombinase [Bacillus thuringiensis]|uniref:DDE-type integrase/transposase/recombinase n=1 Tax=Bacillus thuringiensis TaxID=1428 RepID=UPI003CF67D3B
MNVLNREFKDRQQNETLVTDITYLQFQEGFQYLSVIQDVYNNEVVSWKISKGNDNELVLDTIEMLVQKRLLDRDKTNHFLVLNGLLNKTSISNKVL